MAQDSPKKNSTAKWIVIHIPELIASVALVFAITLTVINVFTRYCLHFTIKGSDEYVCIAFAWMVFPGTAAAYRRHMHYGVDLLVNAFPHKVRCIVDVVVQLIITVIMAICTYLTWILIQNVGSKIMTATRISYRVLSGSILATGGGEHRRAVASHVSA